MLRRADSRRTLRSGRLAVGSSEVADPAGGRYGVAGSQARRFEDVMRTSFPERFMEDRDLLHHLITVAPPSMLASQGAAPPRLTAILDCHGSGLHAAWVRGKCAWPG